ncbi:peroxisomal biogenesis factor 6 [Sodiomyces alkalinus F11]|uniref:Peroxisomal ATPase PEX6 n=1 Tax=Sodiomyces alkalinus (strain CBS 110278 / VKM F-3762 / F11) TaxID=1314773 RepID=A0A3N2PYW4_SODAK|nr:peroxisomal biogenesis factor 6 [Sodiomyces alkalinus F11]ROT39719.1 peroxisomal biogenesis factor 6 [Sodiomyces alkalinus F11]
MAQSVVPATRRRRRRRADKPAISATLLLDANIKGDVGYLSDDLFADLFPQLSHRSTQLDGDSDDASPGVQHVAIAPWSPKASPVDTAWTLVPVLKTTDLGPSIVQFSPRSMALQAFRTALQHAAPSKLVGSARGGIEILVLDAIALPLDAVFVNMEKESIRRLEQGEGTFFDHHPTSARGKSTAAGSPEDNLTAALRAALATLPIIHSGDQFPLPLPPHPVTHVPPNGGEIVLCEPYNQGVLSPTTKIVLMRGSVRAKRSLPSRSNGVLNGVPEEGGDDTANDQFYSAAEERYKTDAQATEMESVTETEDDTGLSGADFDDDSSDDSMDDMIGLQVPMLPTSTASGVSTLQPGSPMTIGRGRRTNGAATPGSVFSSFTATTARPDHRPRGRLFKAQGLMEPIPQILLHPKPTAEDDEEARIFVDISALLKIGCFSGDWVRVEAAEEPPASVFGSIPAFGRTGGLEMADSEETDWRPVRVYSLPEGYVQKPVTRIPSSRHLGRETSFFDSQLQRPTSPVAYLSPVLLANLSGPSHLRLSPLKPVVAPQGTKRSAKFSRASHPPFARDITIQQVRSPVSVERMYQAVVLAGLKRYFAERIRLAKAGDLIAVPIDTLLGRMFQDAQVDNVMALAADTDTSRLSQVVWFKIGHIQTLKPSREDDEDQAEDLWRGVACVDSESVGMNLSGFVTSRIPSCLSSTWEYYTAVKRLPRRSTPTPTSALLMHHEDQRYISPLRRRLHALVAAATSQVAVHGNMSPVAILLTSNHRHVGKATVASAACSDAGLHTYTIDANDLLSEAEGSGSDVKTEGLLKARAERGLSCGPDCTTLLIKHIEGLTADRMVSSMKEILSDARVLIATTNDVDKLPKGLRSLFSYELEMGAPDEVERAGILKSVVDEMGLNLDPDVNLSGVALKTAAFVAGGLVDVVERARIARRSRLEDMARKAAGTDRPVTVRDIEVSGGPQTAGYPAARCVTKADFDIAVEKARKDFAGAIGAPKIPNVTWDDVGGLGYVKEAVRETIQLPLERPELFARGLKKRSGILFYGPPGTGKTLLAKAIATEYSLNFFSVKGPELLNMYIGESEANVRRVFQKARDARPCVVFFDELDSVAPKRGNQGDSGGVMDRIVSQLLAELDGMSGGSEGEGGVFVIGATNRPDLLDPALLRPGRFDKMLYLGVADSQDKQLKILEAVTRKFTLHPSVSLSRVASQLPHHYTGADYYALCSDAMLKAITRQTAAVDTKIAELNADGTRRHPISTANFFDHHATPEDVAVVVTEEDFIAANNELVPSVSAGELARYETMRSGFEGAGTSDGGPGDRPTTATAGLAPAPGGGRRVVSGSGSVSSTTSKGKGKGKGKAVARDKGKGKALAVDSEEEYGSDNEASGANGRGGKGKGKAVAGFQQGTASDDDGLY